MGAVVTKRLAAGLLAACCVLSGADRAGAEERPLRHSIALAVHVHSTISTGSLSLDQLAAQAKAAGLDGIVLTDNYDLHVGYGVWPLRGLLQFGVNFPSVHQAGETAYLDQIRAAERRHPDLLWIPGVEVMPQYRWTGSLLTGDLTLHDTQKNLLVVGLDDPARLAAAVGGCPYASDWPVRLWPALLAVPIPWLWRKERLVQTRTRYFRLITRRRRRGEAAALAVIASLLLLNNLLTARQPFDPYGPDPGDAPAQRIIDSVREAGGLSFWSLPEAADDHRYRMADLAEQGGALGRAGRLMDWYNGSVSVETRPYLPSLAKTEGYTGFGAVYEDTITATRPGGEWDRLLMAYLDGRRRQPVWGIGERAYHDAGNDQKRFGDIQTVVLADSRSSASVLSALRAGAFYARQRQPAWGLTLDDFTVRGSDGEALSGQTISVHPGQSVTVRLAVSASDNRSEPVEIRVIRSGRLWQRLTASTPFDRQWTDEPPATGAAYYRIEVGQGDQHLISNPVFLTTAQRTG